MAQKKLIRFSAIKTFSNVLEYPSDIKGKWHLHFQNSNPIILELACGKGEYTVALSNKYLYQNFVGVDIKGNRLYIGAKKCIDNLQHNAAFLRTQIEMIDNYFDENEVDSIWITFPDPQLRASKAGKRLTHPRFLRLYQKFLKAGGVIHLKTDSPDLFSFTMRVIELYRLILLEKSDDVYKQMPNEDLNIRTYYESLDIARSNKIFYLKFSLPKDIPDYDEQLKKEVMMASKA